MEDDLHGPQHMNCTENSQVVLEAECLVAAPEVVDRNRCLQCNRRLLIHPTVSARM